MITSCHVRNFWHTKCVSDHWILLYWQMSQTLQHVLWFLNLFTSPRHLVILLIEEILHKLIFSLSHCLQGLCIPGGAGFLPSTVPPEVNGVFSGMFFGGSSHTFFGGSGPGCLGFRKNTSGSALHITSFPAWNDGNKSTPFFRLMFVRETYHSKPCLNRPRENLSHPPKRRRIKGLWPLRLVI